VELNIQATIWYWLYSTDSRKLNYYFCYSYYRGIYITTVGWAVF